MTRNEYKDFRSIRGEIRKHGATYGCQFTIPTNASSDYKRRLDALYTSYNMHPASVRVDTHWFDDKERIIYIYGRTWKDDAGNERSWTELYSKEEIQKFENALN